MNNIDTTLKKIQMNRNWVLGGENGLFIWNFGHPKGSSNAIQKHQEYFPLTISNFDIRPFSLFRNDSNAPISHRSPHSQQNRYVIRSLASAPIIIIIAMQTHITNGITKNYSVSYRIAIAFSPHCMPMALAYSYYHATAHTALFIVSLVRSLHSFWLRCAAADIGVWLYIQPLFRELVAVRTTYLSVLCGVCVCVLLSFSLCEGSARVLCVATV